MPATLTGHDGLPLASKAVFQVERIESGAWLADDAEVECHAEGDDPTAAVAALLEAEHEYLEILRGTSKRSPLMERHLQLLLARLG